MKSLTFSAGRSVAAALLMALLPLAVAGRANAQTVQVVPGSVGAQNITAAANFIGSMGDPGVGNEILTHLAAGKYYIGTPFLSGAGYTAPVTGWITIDPGTISNNNLIKLNSPDPDDGSFYALVQAASTLFHENYHLQHTRNEYPAWTAEIIELDRWIQVMHNRFMKSRSKKDLQKTKVIVSYKITVINNFLTENCNPGYNPLEWATNLWDGTQAQWTKLRDALIDLHTALDASAPLVQVASLIQKANAAEQVAMAMPVPPSSCTAVSMNTGGYVGIETGENWGRVKSRERIAGTDIVTNAFEDSGDPPLFGVVAGYNFRPWNNGILVGPFASFDYFRQTINHNFFGGQFLGSTTRWVSNVGAKAGVMTPSGVYLYGLSGLAILNHDLNVNFATSASQNVTTPGVTAGLGAEYHPVSWHLGGHPISIFAQYQHTWWSSANFNRPASSPFFDYAFMREDDTIKLGVTVNLSNSLSGYGMQH